LKRAKITVNKDHEEISSVVMMLQNAVVWSCEITRCLSARNS